MAYIDFLQAKKLTHKVWVGMAILILAYCITGMQSFNSKGNIQKELGNIGNYSEISANAGQALTSNLEAQMKAYMDAVMFGDRVMLEKTKEQMQIMK